MPFRSCDDPFQEQLSWAMAKTEKQVQETVAVSTETNEDTSDEMCVVQGMPENGNASSNSLQLHENPQGLDNSSPPATSNPSHQHWDVLTVRSIVAWVKAQKNGGNMLEIEVGGIECQQEEPDQVDPLDNFPQSLSESSCNDDSSDSDSSDSCSSSSDPSSEGEIPPISASVLADFEMFCRGVTSVLPEVPKKEPDKTTSWRSIRHRYKAHVLDDIDEASMSEEEEEGVQNMPGLVGPI
jgi:hypothetical protein